MERPKRKCKRIAAGGGSMVHVTRDRLTIDCMSLQVVISIPNLNTIFLKHIDLYRKIFVGIVTTLQPTAFAISIGIMPSTGKQPTMFQSIPQ